jgi:hypothetical protein
MRNYTILIIAALVIVGAVFQFNSLSSPEKFGIYPKGKCIKVDFNFSELSEEEFTEREKQDQVKDWILLGILFNSGLDTAEINEITYDLPTNRYGYMSPVSNLEYGETRSRYIGNHEIVSLVPKCTKKEYWDYLAHITDEHRKNLDEIPGRIYVFQYEIDLDNRFALVTRLEDQDGRLLFTEDYGYVEKEIKSEADLKDFMNRVDDLTVVRIKSGDTLLVGGRKIKSREHGRITIEDVAAIWQAEYKLDKKIKAFESKWNHRYYRTEAEKKKLEKEYIEEMKKLNLVDHIGFSLDPVFDYEAIANYIQGKVDLFIERFMDNNPDYLDINEISKSRGFVDEEISMDFNELFTSYGFRTSEILSSLNKKDDTQLFEFLLKYKSKDIEKANSFLDFIKEMRFQKARYDGDLQGTEVGMHLFYTDLLLKLWLSDRFYSSPIEQIPGFMNNTIVSLAKVFENEFKEFSQNRAWLGPDVRKFQFADNRNKLLFGRNITEVFAKSSNPFTPKDEVPVSAFWGVSIDWFNNHYEEITKYEPEYERLNQILKWSAVVSWLITENKSDLLSFLRDIKVKRDHWFPDWAGSQKDLKFNRWHLINFYPKNYMGNKTETMPLLKSPIYTLLGKDGVIKGGVSLTSRHTMKTLSQFKPTPSRFIAGPMKQVKPIARGFKVDTARLTHEVTKDLKVITEAKKGMSIKFPGGEIAKCKLQRAISKESQLIKLYTSQNSIKISQLNIINKKNGFSVGLEARAMDKGQMLTRRLSDCKNPVEFLKQSKDVEYFIGLEKEGHFLIKPSGAKNLMKVEVGAKLTQGSWHSRVSGIFNDSKICNIKWFKRGSAYKDLKFDHTIIRPNGLQQMSVKSVPKSKMVSFKIKTGKGGEIKAKINPRTSEVYISRSEFLKSPNDVFKLSKICEGNDFLTLKELIKKGVKGPIDLNKISPKLLNKKPTILQRTKEIIKTDNPFKLKAKWDIDYKNQLKSIDDLLGKGYASKSIAEIDTLIKIHGQKPELILRKGIAQVKESMNQFGNRGYNRATNLLNDAVARNPGIKRAANFYDNVNTIVSKSRSIPKEQGKIINDFVEFCSPHPDIKIVTARMNKIPKGSRVTAKDFLGLKGNKRLIVQDHPSLNNINWNANVNQSLPRVLESHPNAILYKIPKKDLGLYRLKLKNIAPSHHLPQYNLELSKGLRIPTFYPGSGQSNNSDDEEENAAALFVLYIIENANQEIKYVQNNK